MSGDGSNAPAALTGNGTPPTIWGLDPVQLHDRFWAHRGVQVVRPGDPTPLSDKAQLYLLTDSKVLATFERGRQLETLYWSSPDLVYVRVHDARERGYKERVVADGDRFVRFERIYDKEPVPRLMRAAFTPHLRIAQAWQQSADTRPAWRKLRKLVERGRRSTVIANGTMYDRSSDVDLARLVKDLTRIWNSPGRMVQRARSFADSVWADGSVAIDPKARFVGPVWIGAGRSVDPETTVIGPAVLWDDPAQRPAVEPIAWPDTWRPDLPQPKRPMDSLTRRAKRVHRFLKRGFDICFAVVAILLSLPLYPFIMLAVLIEDGWPFFFTHKRETIGGQDFPCFKFRSMYRDAEKYRKQIDKQNVADGPQVYVNEDEDPRVTKVGRFLRKSRLDELPQFFNVLLGHMSVVGPRPSPFKENQFCPAWREARLSVRPGITGLWQVKRTRKKGEDFQEWIKYDIEYVDNMSFSLDMIIIFQTCVILLAGLIKGKGRKEAAAATTAETASAPA